MDKCDKGMDECVRFFEKCDKGMGASFTFVHGYDRGKPGIAIFSFVGKSGGSILKEVCSNFLQKSSLTGITNAPELFRRFIHYIPYPSIK